MLGETNPSASAPGTIRGDFGIQVGQNIWDPITLSWVYEDFEPTI
jgi:nucleoside diphosphate kinase